MPGRQPNGVRDHRHDAKPSGFASMIRRPPWDRNTPAIVNRNVLWRVYLGGKRRTSPQKEIALVGRRAR